MLLSIALIFLTGLMLGKTAEKLKLPSLVGMIATGIILGPSVFNVIDSSITGISAELRSIALVIILTRAGLSLDINELKKMGRPALLMCFVPASAEIIGTVIIAPAVFGIRITEAALLGCVIAAVSPAVVVPRMIRLIEEKRGTKNGIPQIIMAGASADDVYVIVLFTSFLSVLSGGRAAGAAEYAKIPVSIILGALLGAAAGYLLSRIFEWFHIRDSVKVLILLSVAFLFMALQDFAADYISVSGLIAVMAAGMTIKKFRPELSVRLSAKYGKLWVAAEIVLFVLVGAAVDFGCAYDYGIKAVIFLFGALGFRMVGVLAALWGTKLTWRERLFCMMAYIPKATVQAAIGSVPLAAGLECGKLVLTVAVLAILITAPLGAFLTDFFAPKLLDKA